MVVQGAYLIADDGFLQMGCCMDSRNTTWTADDVRFPEFTESICKDVVCNWHL